VGKTLIDHISSEFVKYPSGYHIEAIKNGRIRVNQK